MGRGWERTANDGNGRKRTGTDGSRPEQKKTSGNKRKGGSAQKKKTHRNGWEQKTMDGSGHDIEAGRQEWTGARIGPDGSDRHGINGKKRMGMEPMGLEWLERDGTEREENIQKRKKMDGNRWDLDLNCLCLV